MDASRLRRDGCFVARQPFFRFEAPGVELHRPKLCSQLFETPEAHAI